MNIYNEQTVYIYRYLIWSILRIKIRENIMISVQDFNAVILYLCHQITQQKSLQFDATNLLTRERAGNNLSQLLH